MPVPKTGPDKFGIEHEIKNNKQGNKPLTDEEVRKKAEQYMEKTNR